MGNTESFGMGEYRNKIMEAIVHNEILVRLLEEDLSGHPEDTIPYIKSYPYEFIPGKTAEHGKFINYELHATIDEKNKTYRNMIIYFYVMCHIDECRTSGGLWYDSAAWELSGIFSDKVMDGIGKTILTGNIPYSPNENFKGRLLTFAAKEYQGGPKNGK